MVYALEILDREEQRELQMLLDALGYEPYTPVSLGQLLDDLNIDKAVLVSPSPLP